jgi:N-acetylmuramoyl-L-alanine amidase
MRKVVISAGHALHVRGARGNPVPPELDEYDQNVRVVNRVFELLPPEAAIAKFIDTTSTSQNQNLNAIVNFHNSQAAHDLDVSIHFNAGGSDNLMGTEVLYKTESVAMPIAADTSAAMATTASWPNRGAKYRGDLAFLNGTHKPAILIEVCFCDSRADSERYTERFEALCQTIAEQISGSSVEPVPPEPEPSPEEATVTIITTGNVKIVVNGQEISSRPFQSNIYATKFGGDLDEEPSAYPPYDMLGDTELYVALPANIADEATRQRGVRVYYYGESAVGKIRDKGPWMIDDPYWETGTRPIAETCFENGTPLPSGPNEGRVPTQPAGIDLSPAMYEALGMTDDGPVDWEFVDEQLVS